MSTFYIKRNDTAPALSAILKDPDGNAVDITGNLGVRFHMRSQAHVTKVDAAATVVDAAAGSVRYSWSAGDTDTTGIFDIEFEVTYSDGSIETFPNYGWDQVQITEDIA